MDAPKSSVKKVRDTIGILALRGRLSRPSERNERAVERVVAAPLASHTREGAREEADDDGAVLSAHAQELELARERWHAADAVADEVEPERRV
ncbi:hypothetical protein PybrP1_005146 [[Pythium] brassicae (nom. inval.)]|nr:hypothetical protein PybrP1_005146 [[Pythium] brassicae (nom. inval.)]